MTLGRQASKTSNTSKAGGNGLELSQNWTQRFSLRFDKAQRFSVRFDKGSSYATFFIAQDFSFKNYIKIIDTPE